MFEFNKNDEFEEQYVEERYERTGPEIRRNAADSVWKVTVVVILAILWLATGLIWRDVRALKEKKQTPITYNAEYAQRFAELAEVEAALATKYREQEDLVEEMSNTIARQQGQINALIFMQRHGGIYAEPNVDSEDPGEYASPMGTTSENATVSEDATASENTVSEVKQKPIPPEPVSPDKKSIEPPHVPSDDLTPTPDNWRTSKF